MQQRLDPARGLIHPEQTKGITGHMRYLPSGELTPWIEHYWTVSWDFRDQPPHLVQTLSHPSIHITFEKDQCQIWGPSNGRFQRYLEGQGSTFGIKFFPGAFYQWLNCPMHSIRNKKLGLEFLFGQSGKAFGQGVLQADTHEEKARLIEKQLLYYSPEPDERLEQTKNLCQRIISNRSLLRVEDLSLDTGLTVRQLQRLFSTRVGWSPKWMIQRYRIHEALEHINKGFAIDWIEISTRLGYFDQAHFIRDFKRLIGETPDAYLRAVQQNKIGNG